MKPWIAAAAAAALVGMAAAAQAGAPQGEGAGGQSGKPPQVSKPQPAKPVPRPVLPGSREPGRPGSFEAAVHVSWAAAAGIGNRAATLTANQAASSQRYTLFDSSGELGAAPGLAATVAYNLTRTFAVEGEFSYQRPPVRVTVSGDQEAAGTFDFDGEDLSQYAGEASLVAHLRRLSFSRGRGRTFVSAGAGYRREVHAGNYSIDTGQVYHAGAGVKYFLAPRARGFIRAYGFRAEGRLVFGVGGFSFAGDATKAFTARAGLVLAF